MRDQEWLARANSAAQRRTAPGAPAPSIALLPPHASARRYARAVFADRSEIAMLLPARDVAPDEVGSPPRGPAIDEPFVVVQRWLDAVGTPVPSIYAIDEGDDVIWLEDLGGTDLDAAVTADPERLEPLYRDAVELLARFQASAALSSAPALVTERRFDSRLLRWELDHYLEWRVEQWLGVSIPAATREAIDAEFDRLVSAITEMPQVAIHRDLQSHNIMVVPGRGLVVLDFQDALVGPCVYDVVALLRDSYVPLSSIVLNRLLHAYAERAAGLGFGSTDEIERWFHVQTVQRKLKDAGRFVFIDRVRGNPSFLRYIDPSVEYVRTALTALGPQWERLRELLGTVDPGIREEGAP